MTVNDFDLIAKNAAELRRLSEAAQWKVSPNIRYVQYSNEFQRLTEELETDARAENIDGATLNYVNLTLNCVNCHKFVRGLKITQADFPNRR